MGADQPAALAPLAQALPILSRQLRKEAKAVRNLGYGGAGRSSPEKTVEEKYDIATRLELLAGTIDAALAKSDGGAR